jgi:D-ribose pyranase
MKKSGILHNEISQVIACLGHGDTIVIADAGLPIPKNVQRIDLALCKGVPSFMVVLETILSEMEVESCILAEELPKVSPDMYQQICQRISFPISFLSHEQFKQETMKAVAVIRTGEFTPYANIILKAGVVF